MPRSRRILFDLSKFDDRISLHARHYRFVGHLCRFHFLHMRSCRHYHLRVFGRYRSPQPFPLDPPLLLTRAVGRCRALQFFQFDPPLLLARFFERHHTLQLFPFNLPLLLPRLLGLYHALQPFLVNSPRFLRTLECRVSTCFLLRDNKTMEKSIRVRTTGVRPSTPRVSQHTKN